MAGIVCYILFMSFLKRFFWWLVYIPDYGISLFMGIGYVYFLMLYFPDEVFQGINVRGEFILYGLLLVLSACAAVIDYKVFVPAGRKAREWLKGIYGRNASGWSATVVGIVMGVISYSSFVLYHPSGIGGLEVGVASIIAVWCAATGISILIPSLDPENKPA